MWLEGTGVVTGLKGKGDGDATYARTGVQFNFDKGEGKVVTFFDWV